MDRHDSSWKRMQADILRRADIEKRLAELYIRRAGREKHVSRIIPEYSPEWENDPGVKSSEKKGEEKMNSAEMMLLVAERQDVCRSEETCRGLIAQKIERMRQEGAAAETLEVLEMGLNSICTRTERMDEAAAAGLRIIRQSGHIKRCLDQALKFRMGSGGLSEPLRAALHGVDVLGPMLERFYTLIGEPSFHQNLHEKIRDCQIEGRDWMWEVFDYDIVGLIKRLFHRPDMRRFSDVDVELLEVRYRVYNSMSRVARERGNLASDLERLARMVAVDVDLEAGEAEEHAAIAG